MKKFLSMILIFVILGAYICAPTYATADFGPANTESQIRLLKKTEVLSTEPEEPDSEISRGVFAIYTARLLDESEIGMTERKIFSDVPTESREAYALAKLVEKGIISGNPDGTFRPNETITAAEASKMLLNILDYKYYAEVKGGYPTGYMFLSKKLGLISTGSADEKMTYRSAISAIYNALHTAMHDIKNIDGSDIEYEPNDDVTLLSVYHATEFEYGTVRSVGGMSIDENIDTEQNEVVIGENRYTYDGDALDLLGKSVTVYYDKSGDLGIKSASLILENDGENIVTITDTEDFDGLDTYGKSLKYKTDSGKEKRINLSQDVMYVINGTPISRDIESTANGVKTGYFEAIDNNRDGAADVILMNSGRNVFVNAIDDKNNKIYGKYNSENPIDYDDTDKSAIVKKGSERASVSDITSGMLVTAFESERCVKLVVSTVVISGTANNITDDEVKIDSKTYKIQKDFLEKSGYKIKAGSSVKCFIDAFGKIGYIENVAAADGWSYGYVIDAVKCDDVFSGSIKIKLFEPSMGVCTFETSDRVKTDGKVLKDNANLLDAVSYNGELSGTVIRFKTKEDNGVVKISEIDTANLKTENGEDSKNSLQVAQPYTNTRYRRNRFGEKIAVNADSLILAVPSNPKTAEEYKFSVADTESISIDTDYDFMSYKLDKTSGYDDVVVCKGVFADYGEKPELALIDEITTVFYDGEARENLVCLNNGFEKEYVVSDNISLLGSGYKSGDLVRLGFNEKGEIAKVYKHYSYNSSKQASDIAAYTNGGTLFNANHRIVAGYAISTNDGVLKLGSSPTDENSVFEIFPLKTSASIQAAISVFDDTNEHKGAQVYRGGESDIGTYDKIKVGDLVVVRTQQAAAYEVIVYK